MGFNPFQSMSTPFNPKETEHGLTEEKLPAFFPMFNSPAPLEVAPADKNASVFFSKPTRQSHHPFLHSDIFFSPNLFIQLNNWTEA
jgi:hypothetical protein